jgi:hypothetical protein
MGARRTRETQVSDLAQTILSALSGASAALCVPNMAGPIEVRTPLW